MSIEIKIEKRFMKLALAEAGQAYDSGEVPVGAVVVCGDEVIARAHNLVECLNDPTAHAEMLVLRAATERLGRRRLNDCVLYVTLEPCAMCAGAILLHRIGALAFGAFDSIAGCCMSNAELLHMLNYKIPFVGGIDEAESKKILSDFFSVRRKHGKMNAHCNFVGTNINMMDLNNN